MKVWITKYALTTGIYTLEEEPKDDGTLVDTRNGYWQFFYAKDWHSTEEAALARAEQMRADKIASLKKQIAKLEKLQFRAREEG